MQPKGFTFIQEQKNKLCFMNNLTIRSRDYDCCWNCGKYFLVSAYLSKFELVVKQGIINRLLPDEKMVNGSYGIIPSQP